MWSIIVLLVQNDQQQDKKFHAQWISFEIPCKKSYAYLQLLH